MGMNVKTWVHGLAAAFISGGSDAFLLHFVDPDHFNLADPAAFQRSATLIVLKACLAVALYLKKSPLPE